VGTEYHQVLGNAGMTDTQAVLQRFHVVLAIPQLFNYANAMRVPKNSKKCGKLPGD
jgi:hypothetical protein